MKHLIHIALTGCLITACDPFIDNHGFNHETLDLQKITIGLDTKDTVREKFGSPSSEPFFPTHAGTKETQWLYITKRTSTNAFFEPKTLLQQTIVVSFSEKDIVTNVKKIEGEHVVEMNKNQTESSGYESSVARDIFGNFGRYSVKAPTTSR
ncbi:MAG: outer membrane protein assembly factor BamE [Candidatus Paracaedibacteraceae bacterium]|nr:outer membrane protein assembly factor BamE [Candidatus Paracaedibacteraceae bacterium]